MQQTQPLKPAQLSPIQLSITFRFYYQYGICYGRTRRLQTCTDGTVPEQAGVSNA